jgi:hypothetical protein
MARKVGQIIRRGTRTWLVRVYSGRDPETKMRKYLNQTVHGGLRDAQTQLNKMLSERDRGRKLDSSKQTLNRFLDCWLELCAKPRLRAKSLKDYEGLLRRYVRPSAWPTGIGIHLGAGHSDALPRSATPRPVGRFHPLYARGLAVGLEAGNTLELLPGKPGGLSGSTQTGA